MSAHCATILPLSQRYIAHQPINLWYNIVMRVSRFISAVGANWAWLLGIGACYAVLVFAVVRYTATPRVPPAVDIAFVFDTTGSMQDKIDGLLRVSARFAQAVASGGGDKRQPYKSRRDVMWTSGVDARLGIVSFGAIEEPVVIRDALTPTADLVAFQTFLRYLYAYGGGREDQPTALRYAMTKFTYRPHARRVLILITDEPLLGSESHPRDRIKPAATWDALITKLVADGFTAYAVCTPEPGYRALAARTGGRFYHIVNGNDFTDILLAIAGDINASLVR